MKPSIRVGLVAAAVFASGVAIACDDMTMTGNDDGYAAKAPAAPVAVAEKAQPITATKTKTPVKQKTAGKPLPQGTTIARTSN